MELLSDELLEDTYFAAVHFELEPEFIYMLQLEMKKRKLGFHEDRVTA